MTTAFSAQLDDERPPRCLCCGAPLAGASRKNAPGLCEDCARRPLPVHPRWHDAPFLADIAKRGG